MKNYKVTKRIIFMNSQDITKLGKVGLLDPSGSMTIIDDKGFKRTT